MNIFGLIYLFVFNNYKFNKKGGNDERYPIELPKTYFDPELEQIIKHNQNKKLLDYLTNPNISIINKLDKLSTNTIKPPNLFVGLDWNNLDDF
jgi:hypothetical protein